MPLFYRLPLLAAVLTFTLCTGPQVQAAESAPSHTMTVQSSTTSVPLGKATLTVGTLNRRGGTFSGSYDVKVSPLSIASEKGELSVDLSEDDLRRLAGNIAVPFHGQATNSSGKHRSLSGQATPSSAEGGNITIKINSERGKLVFRTTYRLAGK